MKKDFSGLIAAAEMGDCLLIRSLDPDIVSDSIMWFTNGHVSHTAMYLGSGRNLIAEFCMQGGTIARIQEYCNDKHELHLLRIKGITVSQAALMKDAGYRSNYNGERYDFTSYAGYIIYNIARKLGIAKLFKWTNPYGADGAEVCSSGYVLWASKAGIDLFPCRDRKTVSPEEILESGKFDVVAVV